MRCYRITAILSIFFMIHAHASGCLVKSNFNPYFIFYFALQVLVKQQEACWADYVFGRMKCP